MGAAGDRDYQFCCEISANCEYRESQTFVFLSRTGLGPSSVSPFAGDAPWVVICWLCANIIQNYLLNIWLGKFLEKSQTFTFLLVLIWFSNIFCHSYTQIITELNLSMYIKWIKGFDGQILPTYVRVKNMESILVKSWWIMIMNYDKTNTGSNHSLDSLGSP